jgi:hypothetical protein
VLTRGGLLKRGWTPALIAAVLKQPDQVVAHQHGYRRWSEHLYEDLRVLAGEADPRFRELAARRRARAQAAARRRSEIPAQYASWRDALGAAAGFLFSLNRYAKHRMCSELQRVEIYRVKNEFLRLLYERGYCTLAWIHRLDLPAQPCRACGWYGGAEPDCDRCGGSGVWRAARTLEFWCFRFLIAGRTYCWHQPRASVAFAPAEGLPPQEWEGFGGEKPVALPRRKVAFAKALLRWVIGAAANEETPAAPVDEPRRLDPGAPAGNDVAAYGAQMPLFAA